MSDSKKYSLFCNMVALLTFGFWARDGTRVCSRSKPLLKGKNAMPKQKKTTTAQYQIDSP